MQKQLDILFIHHLPIMGGATQSLLSLVLAAEESGYTCKVLFLNNSGNAIERYQSENISIKITEDIHSYAHAYGAYNTFISRRPWRVITNLIKTFRSTKKAKLILQQEKPRLVYLNTSVLIPFARASKELSLPVIWHLREQIHNGNIGLRKWMVKTLFKKYATTIISISIVNAKVLGIKNIEIVYNSVDFNIFDKKKNTTEFKSKYDLNSTLNICFVGGSVMSKGADLLVQSFQEVIKERDDVRLIIAGTFNTDKKLKMNRIEKRVFNLLEANAKLKESITFLGSLNNVSELLAASDLLIWPATTPHFARPIMEAMVMGKPVIASNYLSSSEILENNSEGLLVDPNPKAMKNAILNLLKDEMKRERMGKEGFAKAKSMFDASINNEKIMVQIKSILQ
jgi:glycosyltransferase involved in cell wall biosynthesis